MNNPKNVRALLLTLLIFIAVMGMMYWLQSGPDCIRTIDGAVHCECEYKSSSEWNKYKKATHGAWEAVVFSDGYDPCKK